MRDVFYTLLVVWIIWRIMNGVNSVRSAASSRASSSRPNVDNSTSPQQKPPRKMHIPDSEGEYVDFEEVDG